MVQTTDSRSFVNYYQIVSSRAGIRLLSGQLLFGCSLIVAVAGCARFTVSRAEVPEPRDPFSFAASAPAEPREESVVFAQTRLQIDGDDFSRARLVHTVKSLEVLMIRRQGGLKVFLTVVERKAPDGDATTTLQMERVAGSGAVAVVRRSGGSSPAPEGTLAESRPSRSYVTDWLNPGQSLK